MRHKIATLDIETDPFKYGRIPMPFAVGFFDGSNYVQTWGDNCITDIMEYLRKYPESLTIYAHNGGKFDWFYFAFAIEAPLKFIKNRLVQATLLHHTVRDSFAIIPAPLRDYKKDTTNYSHFEYGVRERYRKSISKYLEHDCEYLYEIVNAFVTNYGSKLTIASTALAQLKKFHNVPHRSQSYDTIFRKFYYGGRVQCFQKGLIHDKLKVYDINSSYPNAMKNFKHPAGEIISSTKIPDNKIYFADITADSDGALPIRNKFGLDFPQIENARFLACSHEINAGMENNKLRILKIHQCYSFTESTSFGNFVDHFFNLKILAEKNHDMTMRLVYKLLLNNAYGKFSQNPANFFDYDLDCPNKNGFKPCGQIGKKTIYRKPADISNTSFIDVAIGASITSAARAYLFNALQHATKPLYCDTDSIICTKLDAPLNQTKLGAWKLEATGNEIAICGKKLYALFKNNECIKAASKGIPTNPQAIKEMAISGLTHEFELPAPSYKIGRQPTFIKRKVKPT